MTWVGGAETFAGAAFAPAVTKGALTGGALGTGGGIDGAIAEEAPACIGVGCTGGGVGSGFINDSRIGAAGIAAGTACTLVAIGGGVGAGMDGATGLGGVGGTGACGAARADDLSRWPIHFEYATFGEPARSQASRDGHPNLLHCGARFARPVIGAALAPATGEGAGNAFSKPPWLIGAMTISAPPVAPNAGRSGSAAARRTCQPAASTSAPSSAAHT